MSGLWLLIIDQPFGMLWFTHFVPPSSFAVADPSVLWASNPFEVLVVVYLLWFGELGSLRHGERALPMILDHHILLFICC